MKQYVFEGGFLTTLAVSSILCNVVVLLMLVLILYLYLSLSTCHTGMAITRINGRDQDTIEKSSPLLATHMKPRPEGEGPSSHGDDFMGFANTLVVPIRPIPMTTSSRHSPLALCTQIHTARPLQAHSTDFLRSAPVLTPEPLDICNKSILHTEMKS